jgi:hypothetical protein
MTRMSTLILAMHDSAAGCLKASEIADRVFGIHYRLVTGPVPPISDPAVFCAEREKLVRREAASRGESVASTRFGNKCRDVIELVNDFDRVEIWADPVPNSQLLLLQWLDWLSQHPGLIQKLSVASPDFCIGDRTPESVAALGLRPQEVSDSVVQTARLAWRALQQPSPEAWFALLQEDLQTLPYLRPTVDHMLEELPAVDTALAFSQTRLLEIVSNGPIGPMHVIRDYVRTTPGRILDSWELGERLHGLAECEAPAILGLDPGPFDEYLYRDRQRFARYERSRLSLSELGRALLQRQADFSRRNTIDRWWGGTKLTNDRLWRWDAVNRVLVPPA